MIGIYQIKNTVNGKLYIGSSKNIQKRWYKHKALLRHNKHGNNRLQIDWNNYKESSFEWSVIHDCDEELLFDLEQWYIDILKPEYNIFQYAKFGPLEEETKQKLSEAVTKNYATGKQPKTTKVVYQYDFDGNFVRKWDSITEAAETLGLLKNKIADCLHFKARHTKGTRWSFVKQDKLYTTLKGNGWYDNKPKKLKCNTYIRLIDSDGKIYLFNIIPDAADYLNCTLHQISNPLARHSKVLKEYSIDKINIYE